MEGEDLRRFGDDEAVREVGEVGEVTDKVLVALPADCQLSLGGSSRVQVANGRLESVGELLDGRVRGVDAPDLFKGLTSQAGEGGG